MGAARRGPWLYDASVRSDVADVERAQEAGREQLFRRLNKELPYVVQVHVVSWVDLPNGSTHITMDIYVERRAQAVRKRAGIGPALGRQEKERAGKLIGPWPHAPSPWPHAPSLLALHEPSPAPLWNRCFALCS